MKHLYLVMKQYSKYYVREIVLLLQLILLVIIFSPILSKMSYLMQFNQLADKIESPSVFFQADDYFMKPEFIDPKLIQDNFQEISKLPEVMGIGQTAIAACRIQGMGVNVFFYNDSLVRNIVPMFEHISEDGDTIPVVINDMLSKRYKVGDVIAPESPLFFPVSAKHIDTEFVVIGVLDKASNHYYAFVGGASEPLLESIGIVSDGPSMIVVGSFEMVPPQDLSPSSLLFVQKADKDTIEGINAKIGHLGHAESIVEMQKNSMHYMLLQNPLPFVTALLMLLLSLSTVLSYTYINGVQFKKKLFVYYVYGISIKRLITIAIHALLLLLLICSVISYAISFLLLEGADLIGTLYTLLIVLTIFAVSMLMMFFQYKKVSPANLLKIID